MAKTEFAKLLGFKRERKMASKLLYATVVNDNRPVVTNGMFVKNTCQQRLGQDSIKLVAPLEVAFQRIFSPQHNNSANLFQRKIGHSIDNNTRLYGEIFLIILFLCLADRSPCCQPLEILANILLKNHDKRNKEDGKEPLQHHGREIQVKQPGKDINSAQQAYAHKDKPGCRILKPDKGHIDKDSDNEDIEKILNPEAADYGSDTI